MRWLTILLFIFLSSSLQAGNDSRALSKKLNAEVDLLMEQLQTVRDTARYYDILAKAMGKALECDAAEQVPDKKGRVKFRYRNDNRKRLSSLRPRLIDAGLYYHSQLRNEEAVNSFDVYLKTAASPLFRTDQKDLFQGQAAYYAALLSYGMKKYREADDYADKALDDEVYAADAAEIKACCMKEMLVTHNDSARYVIVLLELHDKAPENANYWRMLVDYFSSPGHEPEFYQFAKDELRKDSTNAAAWALYGETLMRQSKWDEAIASYEKALNLNPSFVEACYNLGVCYSAKAQDVVSRETEITEAENQKKTRKSRAQRAEDEKRKKELMTKWRELIDSASKYLEQTRSLDPDRNSVDWAKPLYKIYIATGQDEKAQALKKQNLVE